MAVNYSSNNSGGDWWLDDEDWYNLENAGWLISWKKDEEHSGAGKDGRWLGALATSASREGLSMDAAIAEWEQITGLNSGAHGCECCGRPHSFFDDEGNYA